MKSKIWRNIIIILIIALNISCDQVSKTVVRQKIEYNAQISVLDHYVILTKVENAGAFLGLGDSIPRPLYKFLMILLPLIIIGYTLYYMVKETSMSNAMLIGISLIIGGGLGNIYDRILYGSVTDFLYFDFVIFHTGIVNMADISVTIGFFFILYALYFKEGRKTKSSKESEGIIG